jgi:myo-inositol 2-dehydrogenase/D-chiro-inositol 1-dehydrogenase
MNLSRRNLIRTAAIVPIGVVSGSAQNSAVKVGLIGSGGRGTFDASILVKDPRARLVALCDIFDDRIEKAKEKIPIENPKVYKNYKDLLASDVDAVIIATPVFLHPEHFEAAVKAGKHIYIEKPAGVDVAGCKRVMQAADAADRKLNITFGFQQRYGPVYLKAKALLDSGAIGQIRMAHSHWIKGAVTGREQPVPPPTTEEEKIRQWHLWRSMYGDIIVETYCHGIDVLNWFLGGHPGKAYGTGGRTVVKRGDNLDHVDVTFDYANNVQATLTGSQIAPKFYRSVNEQFFGPNGVIETAREYWTRNLGKGPVTEKSPREITIDALSEFVRRIQEGKPENVGVRAAESTLTAILGRMAIDLHREVTWDEMMRS